MQGHAPHVEVQVESAYNDGRRYQQPLGHIRVHHCFQVVNQERLPVRRDARLGFEPLFEQSQRTRPGCNLNEDAIDQRAEVEPANRWGPAARNQPSEDHPDDPS